MNKKRVTDDYFKPSKIEVGAKYAHRNHLGAVYLGVGERANKWHNTEASLKHATKKDLVIIKDRDNDISFVGCKVGKKDRTFWTYFYKIA
jgi:hypothetical protein